MIFKRMGPARSRPISLAVTAGQPPRSGRGTAIRLPRLRRVRSARRPPRGVPAIRLALRALLPPAFAGFGQPVGRPAAGHVPDDLMTDLFNAGAEAGQHLSGDAAALTDEAEQDVLSGDGAVAMVECLLLRELEDLL